MRAIAYTVFACMALLQIAGAQAAPACSSAASTYAPWYCSQINQAVYSAWAPWIPVAVLAVFVSFFIGVILFMIGISLRNAKLREFGVGEFYEAAATALIVFMFMYVTASIFGVLPSIFIGNANPYSTSLKYIYSTIMETETLFTEMYKIYAVDGYYASIRLNVDAGIGGSIVGPALSTSTMGTVLGATGKLLLGSLNFIGPVFRTVIVLGVLMPIYTLSGLISGALLVMHAEFYMILFGMYAAIPAFFIPGIVFRALIPTRGIGGMLMAIGIGFYLIMPVLFSVAYFFTQQSSMQSVTSASSQLHNYGLGNGAEQNSVSPTGAIPQTLNTMSTSLAPFWISVFFFPDLIIAMTIAFIVTIAEFFGGMARESRMLLGLI